MDDLISRQEAIDKFEPWLKVEGYSEGELNMLKAILDELRFLPSIEPRIPTEDLHREKEQAYMLGYEEGRKSRKGKWINHRNDEGHNIADCSECGSAIQWFDGDDVPKYCCMCGANMRGKQE